MSVSECTNTSNTCQTHETFECVDVPDKHRQEMFDLLKANADLFAQKDSELSHTVLLR